MALYAVCVGINNYPGTGADLQGCVNDARDWTKFLSAKGYQVITILDEQATHARVMAELFAMVTKARYLDKIVFTFSGHGSWIPDADGDEADGRDEVLVMHDYERGGLLTDDDLNKVFGVRRFGVKPFIISDSCHSGTVHRFMDSAAVVDRSIVDASPRFLPPAHFLRAEQMVPALRVEDVSFKEASRPTTALLSGCADPEYSYDAYIDGRYRGAFTATALRVYKPGMTWAQWHKAIRAQPGGLPSSNFPQSPQIGATYSQRLWKI